MSKNIKMTKKIKDEDLDELYSNSDSSIEMKEPPKAEPKARSKKSLAYVLTDKRKEQFEKARIDRNAKASLKKKEREELNKEKKELLIKKEETIKKSKKKEIENLKEEIEILEEQPEPIIIKKKKPKKKVIIMEDSSSSEEQIIIKKRNNKKNTVQELPTYNKPVIHYF